MAAPSNVGVDRLFRIPLIAAKRPRPHINYVLMRLGDTVKSNALLRRLEQHGHIKRPDPPFMPVSNVWGERGVSYVDTYPGRDLCFVYAKYFKFDIVYRDGCFFPYVFFKGLTPEGERLNVPTGK